MFMTTLMINNSLPAPLNYFMPAEWESHSATWLTWPHNLETWNSHDLQYIELVYIKIIRNLIEQERLNIVINENIEQTRVTTLLKKNYIDIKSISFHIIQTNDSWIRDYGPNFIVRDTATGRQIAINRWLFNSWGKKYPWEKDQNANIKIVNDISYPWFNPGIVLEGGAIDVNGKGVCLTTTSCLLNKNRNNSLKINDVENYLKKFLGVKIIIWLNGSLEGDDTDGHIDNLARFVNPKTIVYTTEQNINGANYENLKLIPKALKEAKNLDGKPFNIIPLPIPNAIKHKNSYLPASYANFYIGNSSVLVPAFNDPNDEIAKDILKSCFPTRKITLIDSRILIRGQGGVHCITQQQPAHSFI